MRLKLSALPSSSMQLLFAPLGVSNGLVMIVSWILGFEELSFIFRILFIREIYRKIYTNIIPLEINGWLWGITPGYIEWRLTECNSKIGIHWNFVLKTMFYNLLFTWSQCSLRFSIFFRYLIDLTRDEFINISPGCSSRDRLLGAPVPFVESSVHLHLGKWK